MVTDQTYVTASELTVLRICAAEDLTETPNHEIDFQACARKGWIACDFEGFWWPTAAGYVVLSEARA